MKVKLKKKFAALLVHFLGGSNKKETRLTCNSLLKMGLATHLKERHSNESVEAFIASYNETGVIDTGLLQPFEANRNGKKEEKKKVKKK
jgi:hypothetical protein